MKMEFLDATGSGEYPNAFPKFLIRLSEFTNQEQNQLAEHIEKFLSSPDDYLELHQLPFIYAVNCAITLKQSKEDEGLRNIGNDNKYTCCLSSTGFKEMIEIIKHTNGGHNWLTPGEYFNEPAFLISRYGPW